MGIDVILMMYLERDIDSPGARQKLLSTIFLQLDDQVRKCEKMLGDAFSAFNFNLYLIKSNFFAYYRKKETLCTAFLAIEMARI